MKNYVITGSIGHISKPVAAGLVKEGKNVSIITSNTDKVKEIEALGAKALIGSVLDKEFLKKAFQGAEVVYTMIPPIWQTNNWRASQQEVAANYTEAIKSNGIKYVVNLSSIGAHLGNGAGPVDGVADLEKLLNQVNGLHVKHLRPSSFYYNFLNQIPMIKQAGIMGANFGADKIALVHTDDIAAVALEELQSLNFTGNSVRYIVSDERTGAEVAKVLGDAIGKQIPWVVFSDEEQKQGLLSAGLPETHSQAFTQMGMALRNGRMQEELLQVRPPFGKRKLEDFANEFKKAFGPVEVVQ
jgi:uncharacterized protein YbjT (DUF2867 family)